MLALVKMTEQRSFGYQTDQRDRQGRKNQSQPETDRTSAEQRGNAVGDKRADHIQRPVGHIGHPQHAEHKTESGGHNE